MKLALRGVALALVAMLALVPRLTSAQSLPQTVSMASTSNCATNGNPLATTAITVQSLPGGTTFVVEGSVTGKMSDATVVSGLVGASGAQSATISANGTYRLPGAGYQLIAACVQTTGSGTATVIFGSSSGTGAVSLTEPVTVNVSGGGSTANQGAPAPDASSWPVHVTAGAMTETQNGNPAIVNSDGSRSVGGSAGCSFAQLSAGVDAGVFDSCVMESVSRNSMLNPSGTYDYWRTTSSINRGVGQVSVCDPGDATPAPSSRCVGVSTYGLKVDLSNWLGVAGTPNATVMSVQGVIGGTPLTFNFSLATPLPVSIASPVSVSSLPPVQLTNTCYGYPTQSVSKSITTAADTIIVANPGAGLSVHICAEKIISQGSNTVQTEYGTAAGCATGKTTFNAPYVMPASTTFGFVNGNGYSQLWQVPVANNGFCLNTTTTAEEDVWYTYSVGA